MTRQCTCGGIIRQHQLTGEREAWTCGGCGRYGAIRRECPEPGEMSGDMYEMSEAERDVAQAMQEVGRRIGH